jgi:hypothetical protein
MLETLSSSEAHFRAPDRDRPRPVAGRAGSQRSIPVADAPRWVPDALWAGRAVRGFPLTHVELQFPTTGYGPNSGRPVERGVGVELQYGHDASLVIQQSREPQMAYGWHRDAIAREGTVLLGFFGGSLIRDGVYVRIWHPDPEVVLDVARALTPIGR